MGTEISAEPVLNRELIEKVIAHIEEDYRRLEMYTWLTFHNKSDGVDVDDYDLPPCGIVGCIAGTAVYLHDKITAETRIDVSIEHRARQLLGLTLANYGSVFFVTDWPEQFRIMYMGAGIDTRLKKDAVVARLRYLLETGK